jgi:hypothetical protein
MRLRNLIKSWRAATNIVEFMGGAIFNGSVSATGTISGTGGLNTQGTRLISNLVTVTYSAAPVIDASLGNDFVMTITDGVAIVVAAPINPPTAAQCQDITFTVRNASGGAHGALTWNAVFKTQATAFSAVATGNSRTVFFRWNGTNWVETVRTAADVAN